MRIGFILCVLIGVVGMYSLVHAEAHVDYIWDTPQLFEGDPDGAYSFRPPTSNSGVLPDLEGSFVIDRRTILVVPNSVEKVLIEPKVYQTPGPAREVQKHYTQNFVLYAIVFGAYMLFAVSL